MNMGMVGLLVAVIALAIVSVFFAYQWYTAILSYKPVYQSLEAEYNSLLSKYNSLMTNYTNLESSYNSLEGNYNTLQSQYNSLQSQYSTLQSRYNSLTINYTNLQSKYDACISMQTPFTTSGTPTTLPAGTYYGLDIGTYTPYTNLTLGPGTYVFTTQTPTILYLLISSQPVTSQSFNLQLTQGTSIFMGENSITLTLNKPEYVAILTPTQTQLTITYNGKQLYITAIQSAPNNQNSCGYNGYPYGYQGCGPIYIVLWLTDGSHYFYVNGAPFCTGFTANPVMGEETIPIGSANTCSGVTNG
ncbi:hypothetical protein [Vulcanisaeta souniana]|uniref:Uncharacterized protein n=1 Tax=Vulcanisaeta souniana JCM 11219 TaxID=1293586 RepID=A0A830E1S4_9CREN|nr:hypothetical protein [Vulcanisaeta souniana]BDR91524.1 hypothetical protein Vsou_06170 [Vulcanisaeta souniana JCM 11219]GGI73847.1 hypothetical protein GCM10007112_08360 [Vulcanisaeta souniana JCM 11219]